MHYNVLRTGIPLVIKDSFKRKIKKEVDMKIDRNGNDLKKQLIEKLKPLNPERVILFGSYAYGQPNLDSDIDLMVVLRDDFMPSNFKENMEIYLKVSSILRDLKRKFPIDLIVYTRSMYERFVELKSSFSKEILSEGVNLL